MRRLWIKLPKTLAKNPLAIFLNIKQSTPEQAKYTISRQITQEQAKYTRAGKVQKSRQTKQEQAKYTRAGKYTKAGKVHKSRQSKQEQARVHGSRQEYTPEKKKELEYAIKCT